MFSSSDQDISINRILEKLMQQSSIKQSTHIGEFKNGVIQVQHLKGQHLAQKPWKKYNDHQNSNLLKMLILQLIFVSKDFVNLKQ